MYFGGTGKFFSCFRLHQCFGICILLTNHCDGIMVIILFGAPGVGKGTQAALLAERKNIKHLSTGEAFRAAIREGTAMGKTAQEYVESGRLVPDEIVTGIVAETIAKPEYAEGYILDGYPRTASQAHALQEILEKQGTDVDIVVNIDVDNDEIINRMLLRGRKDDTREVIADRLAIYNNETAPLLAFFQERGKLQSIDGNAEVEEVYSRIEKTIFG